MTTESLALGAMADLLAGMGRLNAALEPRLGELGLTVPMSQALYLVDPDRPAPAMSVLADRLRCERSTLTSLVDKLQERGFVERVSDAQDRRSKVVLLTEAGRAARIRLLELMLESAPTNRLTAAQQRQWRALFAIVLAQ